jgi:hypothetical protein
MEESIEEKEMREFSWSSLFIVTGISSFIFSGALKLLDGSHSGFLLKIGFLASTLGLLQWLIKKLLTSSPKKNKA